MEKKKASIECSLFYLLNNFDKKLFFFFTSITQTGLSPSLMIFVSGPDLPVAKPDFISVFIKSAITKDSGKLSLFISEKEQEERRSRYTQ
ncbi:MAG: hypothetical protein ACPGTS_01850 [Minisyncoccia bacterium]